MSITRIRSICIKIMICCWNSGTYGRLWFRAIRLYFFFLFRFLNFESMHYSLYRKSWYNFILGFQKKKSFIWGLEMNWSIIDVTFLNFSNVNSVVHGMWWKCDFLISTWCANYFNFRLLAAQLIICVALVMQLVAFKNLVNEMLNIMLPSCNYQYDKGQIRSLVVCLLTQSL